MKKTVELNFKELYNQFAQKTLAVYKANDLLENESDTLSQDEINEVNRELNCSLLMAQCLYNTMKNKGIPEHLISYHLQVDLKDMKYEREV